MSRRRARSLTRRCFGATSIRISPTRPIPSSRLIRRSLTQEPTNIYNHTRGLTSLIGRLADACGIAGDEARRVVAGRVAILELLPYRSQTFPRGLDQLPSVNLARAAAREASATRLLVVPWGIQRWGLRPGETVVHRPARTFSFAPGGVSKYGEAIIDRLIQAAGVAAA
jgi:hypothetical protein